MINLSSTLIWQKSKITTNFFYLQIGYASSGDYTQESKNDMISKVYEVIKFGIIILNNLILTIIAW